MTLNPRPRNSRPRNCWVNTAKYLAFGCCLALPFGVVGEAQEVAAEPVAEPAADAPLQINARVQRIEQQHEIYFDDDGKKRNENHSLRVNLILVIEDGRPVLGYENLKVTRVVTSAAEELTPQDNAQNNPFMHQVVNRNNDRPPQVGIYSRLSVPTVPADALQEITGQMTLKLGQGPLREAVLGPYGEVAGRRARIRGIENSEVSVRLEEGRLRVEMSQSVRELVNRIRLVNERGIDVPLNSWGSGTQNNLHHFSFRVQPEDTHQIIFELFDRVSQHDARFTVSDVPLPVPEAQQGGVELVLDALPVGAGVAVEALDRLPVIVDEQAAPAAIEAH